MDATVQEAGIKYERLLLRAYSYKYKQGISHPAANRRIYYLLYYIRIGYDLRKTGYGAQFNLIRENVIEALNLFLNFRLRSDEKVVVETLLSKAKTAMNEKDMNEMLTDALSVTERFQIT